MSSDSRRWLYGPTSDLLLGCGLLYAVVFVALTVAGDAFRAVLPLTVAINALPKLQPA